MPQSRPSRRARERTPPGGGENRHRAAGERPTGIDPAFIAYSRRNIARDSGRHDVRTGFVERRRSNMNQAPGNPNPPRRPGSIRRGGECRRVQPMAGAGGPDQTQQRLAL